MFVGGLEARCHEVGGVGDEADVARHAGVVLILQLYADGFDLVETSPYKDWILSALNFEKIQTSTRGKEFRSMGDFEQRTIIRRNKLNLLRPIRNKNQCLRHVVPMFQCLNVRKRVSFFS